MVPRGTVDEEPIDKAPVVGLCGRGVEADHEVPLERVDGHLVLPRVVLKRPRQEALREEEARQPEDGGRPLVDPLLEEVDPLDEVVKVRGEGLQGGVRGLHPQSGGGPRDHGRGQRFQVARHDDEALDGLDELLEGVAEHVNHPVEAQQLLREHRVHALVVVGGVLFRHLVHPEWQAKHVLFALDRQPLQHTRRQSLQYLLVGLPAAAAAAAALGHQQEHRVEERVRLTAGAGDVCVFVQAKDLGALQQGEALEVLPRLLEGGVARRHDVVARLGERVPILDHLGVVKVVQHGGGGAPVVPVGDAPAIVCLAGRVPQGLPGDDVELVEEHLELRLADLEVALRELVGDVEAQGAKLSALLQQGVEEGQPEVQLLEVLGLLAPVEVAVLHHKVGVKHVGSDPLGGLERHLDAVLQDGDGELV
mmetsp:Transcript_28121/g.65625  ORF Transcript_28121/g.65625 Transcript_28121/m.65625 type:complete len:421 (+) Transcript_28121:465-1727(+)